MTQESLDFNDSEKEFYFNLGLLSTKFAAIEYNIIEMLGLLITKNFVLTNTILERNSLSQNIDLLKKVNKVRGVETHTIQKLIEQINHIKGKRNLFIHGIWGKRIQKDNDLIMVCREPKLDYSEKNIDDSFKVRTWAKTKDHEFRLREIKQIVENLVEIIAVQKKLIEKLEKHSFE